MAILAHEKPLSSRWLRTYAYIVTGTLAVASGYVFFITPYKIVPGGVYGIAIVLHYMLGLPVGITALAFNIPLTIIGTRILGPQFGAKTIVSFVLTSVFVELLTFLHGESPLVPDDALVSGIFGGVLIGAGVGLIFKAKATSGGSDVIAMILTKYTRMPIAQMQMSVDALIVLTGFIAFGDWRIPLYSWITIFVMGKVIDTILIGISYDKTLFIISDKAEEIRNTVLNDIHRGGTILDGKGMYDGAEKKIIFTVVTRRELTILEEMINRIDPHAFLTVMDANEILGKGFKSLSEKLDD